MAVTVDVVSLLDEQALADAATRIRNTVREAVRAGIEDGIQDALGSRQLCTLADAARIFSDQPEGNQP